jgi:CPA1 family monovalent cation:H+ antiporter
VLIGLELLVLSLSQQYLVAGILAVLAMVCSRFLTISTTVACLKPFRTFSPHVVKILTWGGLRGGISVALALSLPPGEKREFLLVCTYVAVLFSVLVQGGSLPALLRHAKKAAV